MDRIIAVRPMEHCTADRLNLLRARVQEQLPEGFVAVAIPVGVELFEVGAKEPIEHVVAEESKPTTESPSGREVQHVDVPEDDQPIRFVWMTKAECTEEQRVSALSEHDGRWAISVDDCTPEQLAGRTVSEL